MRYIIKCKTCGETFESIEDAEHHVEFEHQDQEAILEFVEELSQELKDFKRFECKDYPYLYFKENPPTVYDSKTKKFYTSKDLREILSHPQSVTILTLLKYLEFKRRPDLKHENEKTLEKLARDDALGVLISEYLLNKERQENLIRQYNGLMTRLLDTLEAKTDYCEICGDKTFDYDQYLWNKLYVKKFELDKKHKITSPSAFNLEFIVNGVKRKVSALRLMHILSKHRHLLRTAIQIGLVDGIQGLFNAIEGVQEKQAKTREQEMLTSFLKTKSSEKTVHVKREEEQLTRKEEEMLKWLKQRVKYGT